MKISLTQKALLKAFKAKIEKQIKTKISRLDIDINYQNDNTTFTGYAMDGRTIADTKNNEEVSALTSVLTANLNKRTEIKTIVRLQVFIKYEQKEIEQILFYIDSDNNKKKQTETLFI